MEKPSKKTSFIRFWKKSNKENEPINSRCKSALSASFRPKTSSNSTIDEYNNNNNNDRYFDEISLREQQQNYYHQQQHNLPFKSPYSVVTAPKTTKATRSCPGGSHSQQQQQNSILAARKQRYSPPLFRYHPTIHEVSGSYENYPLPRDSDSTALTNPRSTKKASSEYNTRISYNNNNSRQRANYYSQPLAPHKTSEYGSADPSPTNQYVASTRIGSGAGGGKVRVVIDNSFDNTDYDTDSDGLPSNIAELLNELAFANKNCKTYKEKARKYRNKCNNLMDKLEEAEQTIEELNNALKKEKDNNVHMKKNLDIANSHLKALQQQQIQNQFFQQQQQKLPFYPQQQFFYNQQQQLYNSQLFPQQQQQLLQNNKLNFDSLGAGEAMCSTTELNTEFHNGAMSQIPLTLQTVTDETKSFRDNHFEEDNSSMEQPRRHLNDPLNGSECKISPIRISKDIILAEQDENINGMGLSLNPQNPQEEADMINCSTKSTDNTVEPINWTTDSENPEDLNPIEPTEKSINKRLRRSFSETDITNICADPDIQLDDEEEVQSDEENQIVEILNAEDGKSIKIRTPIKSQKQNGSLKRYKKFCSYSPKRGDYSSSCYSSDDDAIRILAKQLRQRGQLVRFRPPRKSVVFAEKKIFQKIGQKERAALAEFEYLQDMPTDISELISSPSPSMKN